MSRAFDHRDRWKPAEVPTVNPALCNGCALCVAVCPTDSLAMEGRLPALRPGTCVSAGVCVMVCPTQALSWRRMEELE